MKNDNKKKRQNAKKIILLLLFGILSFFSFQFIVSARILNCSDNPTQLWHFEESSGIIATDICHGYNATLNGDMNWSYGKYKKAVEFNGINTYLDAGNIYPFNQSMPEFSFSLWVNLSNEIAYQSIFRSGYYDPSSEFIEAININEGDNNYALFMGAYSVNTNIINDGNWHHVAGTFNGTSQISKIYIDGVFVSEYNVGISEITATTTPLYFGYNFDNGFLLKGNLDEVAFFNRTLNFTEIQDYYNDSNFCSPVWACSLYNETCVNDPPSSFQCLEVSDFSSCCNDTGLFNNCVYTGNLSSFDYNFVVENLMAQVPTYPYVDVNQTFPIRLDFPTNKFSDVKIYLTELNGSISVFNFSYVPNYYYINLIFDKVGNYPFVINGTNPCFNLSGEIKGTLLVRKPYNVNICGFNDKTGTSYKNNFAYLTAEILGNKKYDFNLEQFITPLGFKYTFDKPLFHTLYSNGCGTLKLYESNETYLLRIFDGIINFESTFSPPNITKSYGTNILIGKQYFNGTDESLNVYLSEKDIRPYFWLFNWVLIIVVICSIIISVFLFFVMPDKPQIALGFGIILVIGSIIARILVWFYIG